MAVKHALRAAQHFDAPDVEEGEVGRALAADGNAVDIGADGGVEAADGLRATDAANGIEIGGSGALIARCKHIRHALQEILRPADAARLDQPLIEDVDRNRNVLGDCVRCRGSVGLRGRLVLRGRWYRSEAPQEGRGGEHS